MGRKRFRSPADAERLTAIRVLVFDGMAVYEACRLASGNRPPVHDRVWDRVQAIEKRPSPDNLENASTRLTKAQALKAVRP